MALGSHDSQMTVEAAAPSNFYGLAQIFGVGGLAHQTGIQRFTAILHPVEDFCRAIDGRAFLVAGDEQAYRAGKNFVALI